MPWIGSAARSFAEDPTEHGVASADDAVCSASDHPARAIHDSGCPGLHPDAAKEIAVCGVGHGWESDEHGDGQGCREGGALGHGKLPLKMQCKISQRFCRLTAEVSPIIGSWLSLAFRTSGLRPSPRHAFVLPHQPQCSAGWCSGLCVQPAFVRLIASLPQWRSCVPHW